MNLFFFLAALSCPKTIVVNTSGYPWNKEDAEMLRQAKVRCGEIYEDAPCCKFIKKYGFNDYSVVCGAPK
jgi:hypothetical protein